MHRPLLASVVAFAACGAANGQNGSEAASAATPAGAAELIVAGGCFWCVEKDFEKLDGVIEAVSGFSGGETENPVYPAKGTDHREAVRVIYDPETVSYRELIDYFWRTIDVTDDGGQFCDRGHSYRTAVFVADDTQRAEAEASKAAAEAVLGADIVTPILDAGAFYPVGPEHQDFYKNNSFRYNTYRAGCRRDATVKALWGDEAYRH